MLKIYFQLLDPAQSTTVVLYVIPRASISVTWNLKSQHFTCCTDLAISSILQAMVKVNVPILCTLSLEEIFICSLAVTEVAIWPRFYKAPNLRFLCISIRGIPRLFDIRTPHLHGSMCSGRKIANLTMLSQLIQCKVSVLTITRNILSQNFPTKITMWY